jgi:DNA-binding beta-propeller fold protein YncE
MMRSSVLLSTAAIFLLGAGSAGPSPALATEASASAGYHLLKSVPLPGDGFWDYLGLDSANHHVFVTHGTHVLVVDTQSDAVVGDIPNTPRVHGVAVDSADERGFISDGGSNTVTIFDLKTLKTIGTAPAGNGPDAITFDEGSDRAIAFNGESDNATLIDAKTGKVAGTVALGGGPEAGTTDGKGMVYVNLEDEGMVVAFDARSAKVTNHWPVAPCEKPSAMAMDRAHARLFIGCRNNLAAVMDAKTGKIITTLPIGPGVDADRFDATTQTAFFSSGGNGTITAVLEDSPDKFHIVQTIATEPAARTMEEDPATHKVYLATATMKPAEKSADNPRGRPQPVPGTFHLLIYGK